MFRRALVANSGTNHPSYTDAILILPAERRALNDHRGKPEQRGAGLHLSVGILFSKSCQRPAVGESVGQFSAFITGEETLKVDQNMLSVSSGQVYFS